MIGQTFSHYKILQKLGEGGMGVVYKAQDTKLLRPVALKFLSPEMTRDQDAKKRFIREARAASALDHPNIAVVHDVDETPDGHSFICMAYYDGQTLASRLAKGSFDATDAVRVALQMAGGLESAHDSGIVHRDIKPSNIIITSQGEVKIVDFGLAKLSASARETKSQMTGGTAAYMSPEQILGNEVDARSDLFSLGVVLYEMVTGKRPFLGEHEAALYYSIVNSEPIPPSTIRSGISPEIDKLILRLLEKDPKNRYQSASDVVVSLKHYLGEKPTARPIRQLRKALGGKYPVPAVVGSALVIASIILYASGALQRWFGTPRVSETQYIGVLPFTSIGGDSTKLNLCLGIFERVVSGLTQMQVIRRGSQVCPASETRNYRSTRDARKGSGITIAVEGSLQWLPDQIRATVTLVDAEKLSSINSREVNVSVADFLDLETKLVSAITEMIGGRLTSAEVFSLKVGVTNDGKAYDQYVRARSQLLEYTKTERVTNAIFLFRQAIQIDSLFALAYAGLGEAYWRKFTLTKDTQCADSAMAACSQGQRLNGRLPEMHLTRGLIYHGTGKDSLAILEYQSFLADDPLNAGAFRELGEAYGTMKQPGKAEAAYKKAIELRSADWLSYHYLGRFYYRFERDSEAIAVWKQATQLAPNQALTHNALGATLFRQEHWTEAIEQFNTALEIDSSRYNLYSNLGNAYYYDGLYARAVQSYDQSLRHNNVNYSAWGGLGAAYKELGSKKLARESFETAARLAEGLLRVNPNDSDILSQLSGYYADLGRKVDAQSAIRKALSLSPKDKRILARAATTFELLGERHQALNFLTEALAQGAKITEIKYSPEMKALREDPRYKQITKGG
jgi:eukaryotic-like serine/threonine-protein kinase